MANIFKLIDIWLIIFCNTLLVNVALSWNTDELEVFDAVDEIKQNFYTLLDVPKDADLLTIKKSFRTLSLTKHPDHNPSPTADVEFRNLALVYDILKNAEKRKYYDNILENGLPDWRQAVYYYRRVRKMGLQEMSFILAVIISIGQYLVAWAVYIEKRLTLNEILKKNRKLKRPKKNKDAPTANDIIDSVISKPSVWNTLPFQCCSLVKNISVFIVMFTIQKMKDLWKNEPVIKETVKPKPEYVPKPPVEKPKRVDFKPQLIEQPPELRKTSPRSVKAEVVEPTPPVISGGLWTDDDISLLIKLVKKHPAGESERWIKIASAMGRTVAEVTFMANKIKENDFRLPTETEEPVYQEPPKKVKTKGGKLGVKIVEGADDQSEKNSAPWTQVQQKAFEQALNKYSRKSASDRWEKIANCVPDKTKEECILRYKKITAAIQRRKMEEEMEKNADDGEECDLKDEDKRDSNCTEDRDQISNGFIDNEPKAEIDEE